MWCLSLHLQITGEELNFHEIMEFDLEIEKFEEINLYRNLQISVTFTSFEYFITLTALFSTQHDPNSPSVACILRGLCGTFLYLNLSEAQKDHPLVLPMQIFSSVYHSLEK